jgi:hypothetical protein
MDYNLSNFNDFTDDFDPVKPGELVPFYAGSEIPDGYLKCDGSIVSQNTYSDLYSQVGLIKSTSWVNTTVSAVTIRGVAYGAGRYVYSDANGLIRNSTNLSNWSSSFSLSSGTTSTILSSTYGNGLYVYGGSGGVLATSIDLVNWTLRTSGTTSSILSLAYGSGEYAYTDARTGYASSTNGINWASVSLFDTYVPAATLRTATYGNGLFVYGGDGGMLATSTNAVNWTSRTSGTSSQIAIMIYGSGRYIYRSTVGNLHSSTNAVNWAAVTSGTTSTINTIIFGSNFLYGTEGGGLASSTNSINWTARTSGTTSAIYALTFGNGLHVYAGNGGVLASSTNLANWTAQTSGVTGYIGVLGYGNGRFLFIERNGDNFLKTIRSSTNLVNWTTTTNTTALPNSAIVYSITYQNNLYILGTSNGCVTSTDSVTWTNVGSPRHAIFYGNSLYFTVSGGDNGYFTSTNLSTYLRTSPFAINNILYNDGKFILSNETVPDQIFEGPNLSSLTTKQTNLPTTSTNKVLNYINGQYFGGNYANGVRASTDGSNWTGATLTTSILTTTSSILDAVYGNGVYVYGGNGGMIRSSTNGINWTAGSSGTTSTIRALTYGNGIFVAGGNAGFIRTSTNGINWTSRTSGTTSSILGLDYGNGNYVYVGVGGQIRASTDAITWVAASSGTTTTLNAVHYGRDGAWVAVGNNGIVRYAFNPAGSWQTWSGAGGNLTAVGSASDTSVSPNTIWFFGNESADFYYTVDGVAGSIIAYTIAPTGSGIARQFIYRGGLQVYTIGSGGVFITSLNAATNNEFGNFEIIDGNFVKLINENGRVHLFYLTGEIIQTTDKFFSVPWSYQLPDFRPALQWYYFTGINVQNMTYGNGVYVGGTNLGHIVKSTNAINWTTESLNSGQPVYDIQGISYNNGTFLYGGYGGISYSSDAANWNYFYSDINIRSLTFGNSTYFASGRNLTSVGSSDGAIAYSSDGINWITYYSTNNSLNKIIYDNGLFLSGGVNGLLVSSTNGISWNFVTSKTGNSINSLTYGNGVYVYGANGGILGTSTNGTIWTLRTSGTTSAIYALTYGNGLYVYGADGGVLSSSTNAVNWTAQTTGTTSAILGLTYGKGLYLMGGVGGLLRTSTNTISWQNKDFVISQNDYNITDVIYGNNIFVYVTRFTDVGYSVDSSNWILNHNTQFGNKYLAQADDIFIYGGESGRFGINYLHNFNKSTEFALPNIKTGYPTFYIKT